MKDLNNTNSMKNINYISNKCIAIKTIHDLIKGQGKHLLAEGSCTATKKRGAHAHFQKERGDAHLLGAMPNIQVRGDSPLCLEQGVYPTQEEKGNA